jgi:hypothetical protein
MNDPNDNDLRKAFARLREQDRAVAPAWRNLPHLQPASSAPEESRPTLRWALALFCLTLLFCLGWPDSSKRAVADLPELFTPQGAPLFTSLAFETPSLPSDTLLPPHLTIQLP